MPFFSIMLIPGEPFGSGRNSLVISPFSGGKHTEVLMELNNNGIMDTAYSYGNERLTVEHSMAGLAITPMILIIKPFMINR